jgi:hypothetical protein
MPAERHSPTESDETTHESVSVAKKIRGSAENGRKFAPNAIASEHRSHFNINWLVAGWGTEIRTWECWNQASSFVAISRAAPVSPCSVQSALDLIEGKPAQLSRLVRECRFPVAPANRSGRVADYRIEHLLRKVTAESYSFERVPPCMVGQQFKISDSDASNPCGQMLTRFHITVFSWVGWIFGRRHPLHLVIEQWPVTARSCKLKKALLNEVLMKWDQPRGPGFGCAGLWRNLHGVNAVTLNDRHRAIVSARPSARRCMPQAKGTNAWQHRLCCLIE